MRYRIVWVLPAKDGRKVDKVDYKSQRVKSKDRAYRLALETMARELDKGLLQLFVWDDKRRRDLPLYEYCRITNTDQKKGGKND